MKFAILHVAVDNDVFARLLCCCSVDHPFRFCHVFLVSMCLQKRVKGAS
jgi:hypothetical protein